VLFGRMGQYLTAGQISYHHRGNASLRLQDTLMDGSDFWLERIVTDGESFQGTSSPTKYHHAADILFRKSDGLIKSWHYTFQSQGRVYSSYSEMWLTLSSIEGN
jgi:hypothetical protein